MATRLFVIQTQLLELWTTVDDCFPDKGDGSQTKPSLWPSFLPPYSRDSPNALPLATSFPKKKKDPGSYCKLLLLMNISLCH